jgi:hypothetical protein
MGANGRSEGRRAAACPDRGVRVGKTTGSERWKNITQKGIK